MLVVFLFFKQKTAYEMRISDWSSDVCSSDLVRDLVLKIARGGGYDPDVHLNQAAAADAGEGLLRHHPQDLALGGERHVGDLVEEQRPAMRLFQQAGADKLAAFLLAEKLLFHP